VKEAVNAGLQGLRRQQTQQKRQAAQR
jgi:hypothetical protein